jgi:hypothetical protein
MRRSVLLVSVALAAALALAGCSAGAGAGSTGTSDSGAAGHGAPLANDAPATTGSGGEKAASTDRSIVVTGELVVTASDPLRAADRAASIVRSAGGRVDGRSERAGSQGHAGTASLTLRIPAAKLDTTLAALKGLGRTDRVSTASTDVTSRTEDLDARITALRATIQRLIELEKRATDTSDLVEIESTIGDRQGDLESLEAQQRGLADQVAMSTITMTLQPTGTIVESTPAGFGDGLATGWSAFVAFWGAALVALGVALPWLLLLALLGAIALGVVAIVRRRARNAVVRPTRG